jgi:hypothetical protein
VLYTFDSKLLSKMQMHEERVQTLQSLEESALKAAIQAEFNEELAAIKLQQIEAVAKAAAVAEAAATAAAAAAITGADRADIEMSLDRVDVQDEDDRRALLTPNFYDWNIVFPEELREIYENIDVIAEEALRVSETPWIPWPEDALNSGDATDWTVFPFLHTFPVLDESRSTWIPSTVDACPKTAAILAKIPNLRTALFSRLNGRASLSSHTGWSDLANYVLRVHAGLIIPEEEEETCGLWVEGEVVYHSKGSLIVFDDSKRHRAFNTSDKPRIVLILDLLRPLDVALGTCVGGHTSELNGLLSKFR